MNELNMIKKNARFFFRVLRRENFYVELEEIEGEFGLVYATAVNAYRATKRATFETYLTGCFKNRINKMRREITERTAWGFAKFDVEDIPSEENLYNRIEAADMLTKISGRLPKRGRDVLDILVNGDAKNIPATVKYDYLKVIKLVANNLK